MQKTFELVTTNRFLKQTDTLPENIIQQLKKQLQLLISNPRHPSLHVHTIEETKQKIFEAYINNKYRFTFQYGKGNQIILRNVDNHDDCINNP